MPSDTQSWVKLASVYTEQQDSDNTLLCFEEAIKQNSSDPDIYYHKGQSSSPRFVFFSFFLFINVIRLVMFIGAQYQEAVDLYTKSIGLDPSFIFGHIQLAVAQ